MVVGGSLVAGTNPFGALGVCDDEEALSELGWGEERAETKESKDERDSTAGAQDDTDAATSATRVLTERKATGVYNSGTHLRRHSGKKHGRKSRSKPTNKGRQGRGSRQLDSVREAEEPEEPEVEGSEEVANQDPAPPITTPTTDPPPGEIVVVDSEEELDSHPITDDDSLSDEGTGTAMDEGNSMIPHRPTLDQDTAIDPAIMEKIREVRIAEGTQARGQAHTPGRPELPNRSPPQTEDVFTSPTTLGAKGTRAPAGVDKSKRSKQKKKELPKATITGMQVSLQNWMQTGTEGPGPPLNPGTEDLAVPQSDRLTPSDPSQGASASDAGECILNEKSLNTEASPVGRPPAPSRPPARS